MSKKLTNTHAAMTKSRDQKDNKPSIRSKSKASSFRHSKVQQSQSQQDRVKQRSMFRSVQDNDQVKSSNSKYYVFWKPYDVLSQFKPAQGSSADTLASYIKVKDIYPMGRLDRDSEGLLLLSDDGLLQHKLCDPRFEHWRSYLVQVEKVPNADALEKLRTGVVIKGQLTRPAQVILLEQEPDLPLRNPPIRVRKTVETAWLYLSLTEGMNRQVRRMTAAVGHPTLRLVRHSIRLSEHLEITLNGLEQGQIRTFDQDELEAVNMVKQKQAQRDTRRARPKQKKPNKVLSTFRNKAQHPQTNNLRNHKKGKHHD